MKPADTQFLIEQVMDMAQRCAASAADAAMRRLDDLEAGHPVRPVKAMPSLPPDADEMDRVVHAFLLAQVEAVRAELDALAPRVKALIAARPKPKVKGNADDA